MANAIKKISVQRGYDVTRYVLSTFGGAGGQHACAVADALGMTSVLIHPLAGALSAYGIGLADVIAMRETAVEAPLTAELAARLSDEAFRPLEESARAELSAQGALSAAPERIEVTRRVHLRYEGTDTPLQVPYGSAERDDAKPSSAPTAPASPSSWRTSPSWSKPSRSRQPSLQPPPSPPPRADQRHPPAKPRHGRQRPAATRRRLPRQPAPRPPPAEHVPMFAAGEWATVPLYRRDALAPGQAPGRPGDHRRGPGDDRGRAGLARRGDGRPRPAAHPGRSPPRPPPGQAPRPTRCCSRSSPTCSWRSPSRWGSGCRSTAHSVNIKERLDFSCAIFDAERRPDRERAAHPGPPGLHGRIHKNGDKPQQGKHQAGRRLRAQRPLPRRHAPPRRHRRHPRLRPRGRSRARPARTSGSTSPHAATTRRSAAFPPAPCPPAASGSRRKASSSTTGSWSMAAG